MNTVDVTIPMYTTDGGGFTNHIEDGNVPVPDGVTDFWTSILEVSK